MRKIIIATLVSLSLNSYVCAESSIGDKTIKYGVPEKGMKSWKDDYSPKKIAQIASYIHSIHGTKPATPKEPQGNLFKDTTAAKGAVADSLESSK